MGESKVVMMCMQGTYWFLLGSNQCILKVKRYYGEIGHMLFLGVPWWLKVEGWSMSPKVYKATRWNCCT